MATTATGTGNVANIVGSPLALRSYVVFHTTAGAADVTITFRDGSAGTIRWTDRLPLAAGSRIFHEFPGQGCHMNDIDVDVGGGTNLVWWIQWDNP